MELLYNIAVSFGVYAVITVAIVLLWLLRHRRDDNAAAKLQRAIDGDALSKLVDEALPWLVTQAEQLLGGGTGAIKRAYVVTETLKLLPEDMRAWLDASLLDGSIDTALALARPLWAKKKPHGVQF